MHLVQHQGHSPGDCNPRRSFPLFSLQRYSSTHQLLDTEISPYEGSSPSSPRTHHGKENRDASALLSTWTVTGTKPESDRLTKATQAKGSVRTQSTAHGPQLPDTFSATLNGEKNMRKPSRNCTRKKSNPKPTKPHNYSQATPAASPPHPILPSEAYPRAACAATFISSGEASDLSEPSPHPYPDLLLPR